MARPGPKPKAKAEFLKGRPQPPAHLSEAEKDIFLEVVEDLDKQKVLIETDTKLISLYACTEAMVRRIGVELAGETLTTESKVHAKVSGNPLLPQYFSGIKLAQQLLSKLGLTPTSRRTAPGAAASDLAEKWRLQ